MPIFLSDLTSLLHKMIIFLDDQLPSLQVNVYNQLFLLKEKYEKEEKTQQLLAALVNNKAKMGKKKKKVKRLPMRISLKAINARLRMWIARPSQQPGSISIIPISGKKTDLAHCLHSLTISIKNHNVERTAYHIFICHLL